MRNSIRVASLLILFVFVITNKVYAWDKDIVHALINKRAAEQSNLNNYMITHLNSEFPDGISQIIDKKDVKTWVEEGGREEDESVLPFIGYLSRSSKHFHDPTKTWDKAGWLGSSQSSLLWAQSLSNQWSWQKAREYYLQALSGTTKNERENKYSNSFRALGQVMHLIADMAVPEHTRDDTHVFKKTIEGWGHEHSNELNTTTTVIDNSIFQISLIQGLSPITNLWDTYPYTGYNPNGPLGLAEYSNYNFLSHDTVFEGYEFPSRTNVFIGEPSQHVAEDGINDNLIYYSGMTSDGKSIPHLAFTTYFFSEISELTQDEFNSINATLDDNCFRDYASVLIPKSISYSAGLINYFFRGEIDMVEDPDNPGQYIIKNDSAEGMSGTFSIYYDAVDGNRYLADSWSLSINAGSGSGPVPFEEPTSPAPAEKGKYILVFNGALGGEEGAIVGRAVTLADDIWEPFDSGEFTLGENELERLILTTTKHTWKGRDSRPPYPSIRVEDGIFKFDDSYTYGIMWIPPLSEPIPVSGVKLKMNIPYATITGYYSLFWVRLYMRSGTKACGIDYGIAEASSYWDWSFMGAGPNFYRTFVGSGEIERSGGDDFLSQAVERDKGGSGLCGSSAYVGDINDWYIYRVGFVYGTDWETDTVSVAIDYIDFVYE